MKTSTRAISATAVLCAIIYMSAAYSGCGRGLDTQCSEIWQTVDDFSLSAGYAASANAIALAPDGRIVVVGSAKAASGNKQWVVRSTSDGGATWTTLDSSQYAGGTASSAMGIAFDSSGLMYVSGFAKDGATATHGIVVKYSPTPTLILDQSGTNEYLQAIQVDRQGAYYTAGTNPIPPFTTKWITRVNGSVIESTTLGTTAASASSGALDANGNFYAVGTTWDGTTNTWMIRRGNSSGNVTQLDPNFTQTGQAAVPSMITIDPSGNIFVAGFAHANAADNSNARWTVRRSSDQGATWTTVDDFPSAISTPATSLSMTTAYAIAFTPSATYVGGGVVSSSATLRWTVRRSGDGVSGWGTVDDFQYAAGQDSYVSALAVDSTGKVFAAGKAYDSAGVLHWLVRKSACKVLQ